MPFLFGLYSYDSTKEERNLIDNTLTNEFMYLFSQVRSLKEQQVENNKKLSSAFRVIKHDVSRTDRQLPAFKDKKAPGLKMVTKLLKTYCIFNPPIGYLQGMNDLFVPILLSFMPNWDSNGFPINNDGSHVNFDEYIPKIFWCYDAMLRNTNHIKILSSITAECQKLAENVFRVLSKVSPIASIWIKRNNISSLLWLYSDFVLLFKRSFANIWDVWLVLNSSPKPEHWMKYFVTAVIMRSFDQLSLLPEVSLTTMMDAFPKIMNTLSIQQLGDTALWLAEKVPPEDTLKEDENIKTTGFSFFEPVWN